MTDVHLSFIIPLLFGKEIKPSKSIFFSVVLHGDDLPWEEMKVIRYAINYNSVASIVPTL